MIGIFSVSVVPHVGCTSYVVIIAQVHLCGTIKQYIPVEYVYETPNCQIVFYMIVRLLCKWGSPFVCTVFHYLLSCLLFSLLKTTTLLSNSGWCGDGTGKGMIKQSVCTCRNWAMELVILMHIEE
jgi:hypothetical protein